MRRIVDGDALRRAARGAYRELAVADQRLLVLAVVRVHRDADHRLRRKRAVADRNRRFKRAQDLVRGENRHALAGDARQQAGELVAAHPAELVLLAQHAFAHAPGDAQHERFAPLQSEQAIHLLDLLDLDQEQAKLLALLPVALDRRAEDFHEGRVFGGRQRPHHAATFLAARRERGENGKLAGK